MSGRHSRQSAIMVHGPFSSRYWHLDGERHDYDPVLFIGGAFQTKRSLAKFAKTFQSYADVILVDLPGTGKTDIPPVEMGGDFFADCIEDLLIRLHIKRINLVGISFGTAIAYTFAQQYSDRVANLVLIGTMSHANERIEQALERSFESLDHGDLALFAERISAVLMNHEQREHIPEFQRGERLLRIALSRMTEVEIEQFRTNGRRILLHRRLDLDTPVTARTLVFTGEFDSVTTPEHCLEVASTIAGDAHWVLIGGADHLVALEQFELCVRLTDDFLRGVDPAPAPELTAVRRVGGTNRSESTPASR